MDEKTGPVKPGESEDGTRELARGILAHIAQLPELQAFWAQLPPTESPAFSGYEREQATWMRLLGHIPTYVLMNAIEKMILDALPAVMRDLVSSARDC